ncbi:DNA-formamidopyrimidine glycosylase [Opitutaceae bacterium EW11]|nr:DNA-formamidopyrimidine glycosylase [Opitutaceae bacterium EW11]
MPELAEVEYYRKRWDPALGQTVARVILRPASRLLRGANPKHLSEALTGAVLESSAAAAKQMLFRFSGDAWLGIHLGMTGELKLAAPEYLVGKHDHLVLFTAQHALVFSDFRQFGRIQFSVGPEAPDWWTSIAPPVLSSEFTPEAVAGFLRRRQRAPIKAVLLMQERFPGIGNWMADEILWRAEIHPKRPAGSLSPDEIQALWREARWVCREALRTVGQDLRDPPRTWLFPHRWENGGVCPKTGVPLVREEIGGRTTCWSPGRQKLKPGKKSTRASRSRAR